MNTQTARKNILDKLTAYKNTAFPLPENESEIRKPPTVLSDNYLQQFSQNLTHSKADVIFCGEEEMSDTLGEFLQKENIQSITYGKCRWLSAHIKSISEKFSDIKIQFFPGDSQADKNTLFDVRCAITTAYAGIASTGSVILYTNEEEPRTLSLIPGHHIVIVRQERIFALFNDFVGDFLRSNLQLPTNLLIVSGPSRTADIEGRLCVGIHGPERLTVIVVR